MEKHKFRWWAPTIKLYFKWKALLDWISLLHIFPCQDSSKVFQWLTFMVTCILYMKITNEHFSHNFWQQLYYLVIYIYICHSIVQWWVQHWIMRQSAGYIQARLQPNFHVRLGGGHEHFLMPRQLLAPNAVSWQHLFSTQSTKVWTKCTA